MNLVIIVVGLLLVTNMYIHNLYFWYPFVEYNITTVFIFECHSEELFENGGINSLFETKDMSASAGDSHCQGAVAAEVLKSHHPFL